MVWELVAEDHVPLRRVPSVVSRISRYNGARSPTGCYWTCLVDLLVWLLVLDCAVGANIHGSKLGVCLDETPLQGKSRWNVGFHSLSWHMPDGSIGRWCISTWREIDKRTRTAAEHLLDTLKPHFGGLFTLLF